MEKLKINGLIKFNEKENEKAEFTAVLKENKYDIFGNKTDFSIVWGATSSGRQFLPIHEQPSKDIKDMQAFKNYVNSFLKNICNNCKIKFY